MTGRRRPWRARARVPAVSCAPVSPGPLAGSEEGRKGGRSRSAASRGRVERARRRVPARPAPRPRPRSRPKKGEGRWEAWRNQIIARRRRWPWRARAGSRSAARPSPPAHSREARKDGREEEAAPRPAGGGSSALAAGSPPAQHPGRAPGLVPRRRGEVGGVEESDHRAVAAAAVAGAGRGLAAILQPAAPCPAPVSRSDTSSSPPASLLPARPRLRDSDLPRFPRVMTGRRRRGRGPGPGGDPPARCPMPQSPCRAATPPPRLPPPLSLPVLVSEIPTFLASRE